MSHRCQLGRLYTLLGAINPSAKLGDLLLCANWGDFISNCQMGRFVFWVPNGANTLLGALNSMCQMGRYPDHGLVAFHAFHTLLICISCYWKEFLASILFYYLFMAEYFIIILWHWPSVRHDSIWIRKLTLTWLLL